jgi:DNA-binding NarL/FixJ family response regulator
MPGRPVRVLVVDDLPDMREIVRLLLQADGRYEVVGEAVDGVEAIAAAERLQPELVLLDRSMPRLSGLEALPEIRRVAPRTSVVLYTAEADPGVRQAAVAAGAIDVLAKDASVADLATLLADALVRVADQGTLSVHVGPVDSSGALEWIENATRIVAEVRTHPDLTDQPVPPELFDTFQRYLSLWAEVAEADADFLWAATAEPEEVVGILEAWATIDRIDDQRLAAHGLAWSSGGARRFYEALTGAVLRALEAHEATLDLADRLRPQWGGPG